MGAPKAPGDEAKHHIMRLGAHILHPPPLKLNLHPLLAFGGVPTCVMLMQSNPRVYRGSLLDNQQGKQTLLEEGDFKQEVG